MLSLWRQFEYQYAFSGDTSSWAVNRFTNSRKHRAQSNGLNHIVLSVLYYFVILLFYLLRNCCLAEKA